ncbi:MAG: HesA/MoeB/ThiF family protein [Bacteroidota bacterium]
MLSQEEKSRYSKQTILPEIGIEGQERLKNAKVLVIGAGGLGCPILQYLTAAGVGTIGIADGDVVNISNLQRQVLYTEAEIGEKKVDVANHKLKALNPNVTFETYPFFIDSSNALDIISKYDIVVDGSDNFAARYLVNDACIILNKPMVFGAIYKFEGQVSVFNYQDGPTYRCIFPEAPGEGESPNCADIGVVATLPGIIGTIQANEVMKIITQTGEVISGKLLTMNTLDINVSFFSFKAIPENKRVIDLRSSEYNCGINPAGIKEITYSELKDILAQEDDIQLIDVREYEEYQIDNIGGLNIPLSQFKHRFSEIDAHRKVVLYCSSGVRGSNFGKQLLQKGYRNVFNLKNGINELIIS